MTVPPTGPPVPPTAITAVVADVAADPEARHNDDAVDAVMPRMGRGPVLALIALVFGTSMTMVVPMAHSLTVRLARLAPGREEMLGYIIGAGAVANVVTMPLVGSSATGPAHDSGGGGRGPSAVHL